MPDQADATYVQYGGNNTSSGGGNKGPSGGQPGGYYGTSGDGSNTSSGGGKSGGGKPGGGSPFSSGTAAYTPSPEGFYGNNSQPIAGSNPLQNQAGYGAANLGNVGQGGVGAGYDALGQAGQMYGQMGDLNQNYQNMVSGAQGLNGLSGNSTEAMDLYRSLTGIGQQKVTGANVASDPAIAAANQKFKDVMQPMIQDAAGLSGIGRSDAMTNALSSQQAQTLLPLIQDSMAREERGIDRQLGSTSAAAGGLFGGGQQETNRMLSQLGIFGQAGAAQQQGQQAGAAGTAGVGQALAGLGGQEQNMALNAINAQSGQGGTQREIEQQQLNAPWEDQMRQYEEALNSIYGPFSMLGGTFGSSSTSNGGKK